MEKTVTLSTNDQKAIYGELIGLSVHARSYIDNVGDETQRLVATRLIASKLGTIYALSGSNDLTWEAFCAVAPGAVSSELGQIVHDTIYSFASSFDALNDRS